MIINIDNYINTLKNAFSEDFWKLIQHKKTFDFGCGEGGFVVGMAANVDCFSEGIYIEPQFNVAEEIYFQTVIMNSKYAKNVVSDSLRYIDWTSGRGGYWAIIDTSDIEKLESSNNLFARKFESPVSDDLKLSLTKNNN